MRYMTVTGYATGLKEGKYDLLEGLLVENTNKNYVGRQHYQLWLKGGEYQFTPAIVGKDIDVTFGPRGFVLGIKVIG